MKHLGFQVYLSLEVNEVRSPKAYLVCTGFRKQSLPKAEIRGQLRLPEWTRPHCKGRMWSFPIAQVWVGWLCEDGLCRTSWRTGIDTDSKVFNYMITSGISLIFDDTRCIERMDNTVYDSRVVEMSIGKARYGKHTKSWISFIYFSSYGRYIIQLALLLCCSCFS